MTFVAITLAFVGGGVTYEVLESYDEECCWTLYYVFMVVLAVALDVSALYCASAATG